MVKLLALLCVILCFLACSHNTEPAEETEEEPSDTAQTAAETEKTEEPVPAAAETAPPQEEAVAEPAMVEWTDFIRFNGQSYYGDWRKTTIDDASVGELLGEVESTVPSEIPNFSEFVMPENASFLCPEGTEFYLVTDNENAIAAFVDGQYYLYQLRG